MNFYSERIPLKKKPKIQWWKFHRSFTLIAMSIDWQMKFKNPRSVPHRFATTIPGIVVPAVWMEKNCNECFFLFNQSLVTARANSTNSDDHWNESFELLERNNCVRDKAKCIALDRQRCRNEWKIDESTIQELYELDWEENRAKVELEIVECSNLRHRSLLCSECCARNSMFDQWIKRFQTLENRCPIDKVLQNHWFLWKIQNFALKFLNFVRFTLTINRFSIECRRNFWIVKERSSFSIFTFR